MSDVVYDAGALIAADRSDRAFWADHRIRLEQGTIPIAPAAVVAQVSRSPRQVQLRRMLRGCEVPILDEGTAHKVGAVLALSGTADVVDAAVVVEALASFARILTSDQEDVAHLLQAIGASLVVVKV
jgi:hypothetical protein